MLNGVKREFRTDDGSVWLMEGDCLEILPQLQDESLDMIWTDAPYGHANMEGDLQAARVRDQVKGGRVKVAEPIANDGGVDMRRVVDGMLHEAARLLRHDCCCCCCCCCGGGPKPTFAWSAERMDRDGLEFFHAVVWDKSARGNGMGWRYRRNYEFVMVAHRKGGRLLWANDDHAVPNVVRHAPPRDRIHPNEKPLELVADFLKWHTSEGQTVCDPFMGSGTTGEAAIRLGRKFIGIELDAEHFETSRKRISEAIRGEVLLSPPTRNNQRSFIGDSA